jgi:tetratricopeptide (TPR) repeat protein
MGTREKQPAASSKKARPAAPPLSGRRLWVFRLAAVVLPPLLLLALEGSLRLFGVGYSTNLFRRLHTDTGAEFWTDNPSFTRRFFPLLFSPEPRSFKFPVVKDPGTTRIFVFGESAALGEPDAKFGFASMLKVLLQHKYPERDFEIVNLSIVAINSHVIREIAREAAHRQGDLWVIYMGNNEVIGPFGSLTVFGATAPPLLLARASLVAQKTRTAQLLDDWIQKARRSGSAPTEWRGMNTFADRELRHDDPALSAFITTLTRTSVIFCRLPSAGARVVLCTVGTNVRDCPPFASLHRDGLTPEQSSAWAAAFQEGNRAQAEGRAAEALTRYRGAADLDDSYAELLFRMALSTSALGQYDEAAQLFARARDCDALQFRADSRVNSIIRSAAASHRNVSLVDIEKLMSARGDRVGPGRDLFFEHVHLNSDGNYLVATAIAAQIAAQLRTGEGSGSATGTDWLDMAGCLERLGYTDVSREEGLNTILKIVTRPPFREESHRVLIEPVRQELERLRPLVKPSHLRAGIPKVRQAVVARPQDPDLHRTFAELLDHVSDYEGAESEWRAYVRLLPHSSLGRYSLGQTLERRGDIAGAKEQYLRSIAVGSSFAGGHERLGVLLARSGIFVVHFHTWKRQCSLTLRSRPFGCRWQRPTRNSTGNLRRGGNCRCCYSLIRVMRTRSAC